MINAVHVTLTICARTQGGLSICTALSPAWYVSQDPWASHAYTACRIPVYVAIGELRASHRIGETSVIAMSAASTAPSTPTLHVHARGCGQSCVGRMCLVD